MPVKVKCSGCDKVLSVPDAARGKAVKCPACQTRIAVPSESATAKPAATKSEGAKSAAAKPKPKAKKPAKEADSEFALMSFDMKRAEDTAARVCPKCGFDMKWQDEEDNECPECGFDASVGGMGVKAKKRAMKGQDPADFYPNLVSNATKFLSKNISIAFRTIV
jgi:LSD1 subclass zinc finger protein